MLPKVFVTLLHTLFWAIPAYILHPWAGAGTLMLGTLWFFMNPASVRWLPHRGTLPDRMRQILRLAATLAYWAVGTAAMSGVAFLIRTGWHAWRPG